MTTVLDSILGKKFLIKGEYCINGSNCFISFKLNGNNIEVTEENGERIKINNCFYSVNNEKICLFLDENKPYNYMFIRDELWIPGHGGAMNFRMETVSNT